MRWIVGSSLKFRFTVVALTAFLMFFGVQQLGNTSVDVFPEFATPKVEVHTIAIGLGPTEVEELITTPMEQSFNAIPGVETIRSRSVQQPSQVVLFFEQGTDLLEARQLVAERIATITPTLPSSGGPAGHAPAPVCDQLGPEDRALHDRPRPGHDGPFDDGLLEDQTRLLWVPGVANVPIWGERLEMLQVQADQQRLAREKVTLEQVMTATSDALDAGCSGTRAAISSGAAAGSRARTSGSGSGTCSPSSPTRTWPTCPSSPRTAGRSA